MQRDHPFLPHRVHEVDLSLFRRVSQMHSPALDRTLPRLSRFADRSKLWMLIAAALMATGDKRSRRAAVRGLLSLAATSAFVNLPVKLLARRTRPDASSVPLIRRLARVPLSSSFPSGHTASASAFAVGASIESPKLAPALGALAAGVGASRVYTGVHYPSDVVAGAAIGAAIAATSLKLHPSRGDGAADIRPTLRYGSTEPSESGKGLAIVVNPSAGSALSGDPTERLRKALPDAKLEEMREGVDLVEQLRAAAVDARAIGVCGGDGTINAAAAVAYERGVPLAVIPGGTLNHLASALGLSTIEEAAEAVRSGKTASVDLGSIAGHNFLNTASFGIYSDVVDERERLEGRLGKWPAFAIALARVLRRSEPIRVAIDGVERCVWLAFIGNCRYGKRGLTPGPREQLDDGLLDIRIAFAERRYSRLRLIAGLLTGSRASSGIYEERVAQKMHVRSLQGPLRLARDGETFDGPDEFTVEKCEGSLPIYALEA